MREGGKCPQKERNSGGTKCAQAALKQTSIFCDKSHSISSCLTHFVIGRVSSINLPCSKSVHYCFITSQNCPALFTRLFFLLRFNISLFFCEKHFFAASSLTHFFALAHFIFNRALLFHLPSSKSVQYCFITSQNCPALRHTHLRKCYVIILSWAPFKLR